VGAYGSGILSVVDFVGELRKLASDQRDVKADDHRKNVQNHYDVKAESIKEFRKEHGGNGVVKALAVGVVGTLIFGGFFALLGISLLPAMICGSVAGVVCGLGTILLQDAAVQEKYDTYLNRLTKEASETKGKGRSASQEYDNSIPGKSHVADVLARQQNQDVALSHSR